MMKRFTLIDQLGETDLNFIVQSGQHHNVSRIKVKWEKSNIVAIYDYKYLNYSYRMVIRHIRNGTIHSISNINDPISFIHVIEDTSISFGQRKNLIR